MLNSTNSIQPAGDNHIMFRVPRKQRIELTNLNIVPYLIKNGWFITETINEDICNMNIWAHPDKDFTGAYSNKIFTYDSDNLEDLLFNANSSLCVLQDVESLSFDDILKDIEEKEL